MKKYIKNKGFISEKFYKKVEMNSSKKIKNIIICFLIINISLIPNTIENIIKAKEKEQLSNIRTIESVPSKININNISLWIDYLFNENILQADITNGNGMILISNIEEINNITLWKFTKIIKVNNNENGKYKLEVRSNE